jgi:hypothetical protein
MHSGRKPPTNVEVAGIYAASSLRTADAQPTDCAYYPDGLLSYRKMDTSDIIRRVPERLVQISSHVAQILG